MMKTTEQLMSLKIKFILPVLILLLPTVSTQEISCHTSGNPINEIFKIRSGNTVFELTDPVYSLLVSITGSIRHDGDSKWRCYSNITVTNQGEENTTVRWIYLNALNVTYIDETSEDLGIMGNQTVNQILQPNKTLNFLWMITTIGFLKEPKLIWVTFKVSILETIDPMTWTIAIPEFSIFHVTPLFMITTLLVAIVYKRKHVHIKNKPQQIPEQVIRSP